MHLTKKAVVADINKSRSVEAIRLSTDELPAERNKKIKDLKTDIERKLRQNKNLTVVIVEQTVINTSKKEYRYECKHQRHLEFRSQKGATNHQWIERSTT